MQTLIERLERYTPENPIEQTTRLHMLHLALTLPGCLNRKTFAPGHFTASPFICTPDYCKVLMLHHATLNRWFQPGGHADDDADLLSVGLREVEEELGLKEGDFAVWQNGEIFDLDCHRIPPNSKKAEPEHIHFDMRFLFVCAEREIVSPEGLQTRWWGVEEGLKTFPRDRDTWRCFDKIRALAG